VIRKSNGCKKIVIKLLLISLDLFFVFGLSI
jgi:hypothetical protein